MLLADEEFKVLLVLTKDEAIEDDEVGDVKSRELLVLLEELDVDRRASDMLARVVRPQLGSTSSAKLLICVVILSRRAAAFVIGLAWACMAF